MNYYRRYVGNYLKKTARLSMIEHGAYNLMLDYYYAEEKPLPADHREVYRLVRAVDREEQKAVDRVLGAYFVLMDDGYHNKRADAELGIAQATIEKQRVSGSKAAAKRWSTDKSTYRSTHRLTHAPEDGLTHIAIDREDGLTHPPEDKTDGSAIQPPTTNHHPPTTNHQPPASNQNKKVKNRGKAHAAEAAFVLPDWVPKTQWDAWVEARTKRRNPPTEFALKLALIKLEHLRDEGHSVSHILANAAFNGYSGLWIPKEGS